MDEKLSIYDIAEILTAKTGREKADIETFIETLIAVINDVITHNGVVRDSGKRTGEYTCQYRRANCHSRASQAVFPSR